MHIDMVKQDAALIFLLQFGNHQNVFAGSAPAGKMEMHLMFILRFFQPLHLFQPLFTAFCGADGFFPVERAVALNDRLLPLNFLLLQFPGLHADFKAFRPLGHILGIIALIEFNSSEQQFTHVITHMVHEIAVMGYKENRTAVGCQVILQPADRFQVQVVGRFVQKQQIRFLQEHPAKTQPRALAA